MPRLWARQALPGPEPPPQWAGARADTGAGRPTLLQSGRSTLFVVVKTLLPLFFFPLLLLLLAFGEPEDRCRLPFWLRAKLGSVLPAPFLRPLEQGFVRGRRQWPLPQQCCLRGLATSPVSWNRIRDGQGAPLGSSVLYDLVRPPSPPFRLFSARCQS